MTVNAAALDLITEFEGFVDHWYPDPAHGWKVPTCCYGHTDAAGEPKYADTKAKTFTKAEGRAILAKDLGDVEDTVARLVKVPLNEDQRGSLVSFTFNLGAGNFSDSTLLKKLNARDYAGAAGQFGRWNRAGGKVLKGLTRRRAAEAALFASQKAPTAPSDVPRSNVPVGPLPAPTGQPTGLGALLAAIIQAILSLFRGRRSP